MAHIAGNLFRKPRTEAYPLGPASDTPKSYRGRVRVDADKCVGCSTCAQVCVGDAIHLQEEEKGIRLIVWHARCTFCGLCEYYCPTGAIKLSNDWNLAHANADKYSMVEDVLAKYQVCMDCNAKLMVPHGNVFTAAAIGNDRNNQILSPRCEPCRRKQKAKQIMEIRL
jgi:formate hydrogenlyase subunit 6/NADH:ubiquinone oxidoreductase subunit I